MSEGRRRFQDKSRQSASDSWPGVIGMEVRWKETCSRPRAVLLQAICDLAQAALSARAATRRGERDGPASGGEYRRWRLIGWGRLPGITLRAHSDTVSRSSRAAIACR